jgi:HPt (histidine-containing phosphotransfer) domain-containing protein
MSESKEAWLQRVADMHGLDTEDIEEIAEMCLEDTLENLSLLENISDMQDAIRAAHSIKGSAANIGLMPLSEAAKSIEDDLREGQSSSTESKISALKGAFHDFKNLMNS